MSTKAAANQNSNYAFEIRFVDNNIVQVFDIAAKRKQQNDNILLLPTEYKQEEVLKGQLRYSKLMGSSNDNTHSVAKDTFGFEDNGLPYKHIVTTRKSKNRKSTQRHTFFMMGGGDVHQTSAAFDAIPDDIDDGYDSGTAVTEINADYLDHDRNETFLVQDDNEYQQESSSTLTRNSLQQQQEPIQISSSLPSSPSPPPPLPSVIQPQHVLPTPTLPPAVKQRIPTQHMHDASARPQPTHNHLLLEMQHQRTPSNVTVPASTQDYTSIAAVTTSNSKHYIQQQQPPKAPKRGCCCIIS